MRTLLLISFSILSLFSIAQNPKSSETAKINASKTSTSHKPKLVIGIVVDQMRWDYVNRFKPFFKSSAGFTRFINEGASVDNTLIPYLPTVTACGHACVYTGSVPALHGIAGNEWYDNVKQKNSEKPEYDSTLTKATFGSSAHWSTLAASKKLDNNPQ